MRALLYLLSALTALLAGGRAHAELPRLVLRLGTVAAALLPSARAASTAPAAAVARRAARLGVTDAALVPPPPCGVAAVTRVEGFAARALQPRLTVQSPVVRSVKLTPMWPVGAYLTFEYAMGPK